MDEEEIKNDGVAIVIILVAFALLGLIGYLESSKVAVPVINGEVVTSTFPEIVTSTPIIEP